MTRSKIAENVCLGEEFSIDGFFFTRVEFNHWGCGDIYESIVLARHIKDGSLAIFKKDKIVYVKVPTIPLSRVKKGSIVIFNNKQYTVITYGHKKLLIEDNDVLDIPESTEVELIKSE